jgi:hypothetical protein
MQIPVTTSGRTHPYHPQVRPRLFPFIVLILTFPALAQDVSVGSVPGVLNNTGQPMRVGYECAEEDLQWAGMSCSEGEPCPIYLELNAVVANGRKILAAGNLHSTSATLNSLLLESDDSGATWKEPVPRLRGAAVEQLQFYDPLHAWAAGETQYPLPRDPFVLLTTDGGALWSEKPVGEEGNAGSVQRFWFDTAEHGELIIDAGKTASGGRYLSYESETSGASWLPRGADDRLPALRRAPAAVEDPDWRIRTAKDGKAWQIEKREGDGWGAVASFLIDVANCKIDRGQPAELKP